jgi:hypothetical protein
VTAEVVTIKNKIFMSKEVAFSKWSRVRLKINQHRVPAGSLGYVVDESYVPFVSFDTGEVRCVVQDNLEAAGQERAPVFNEAN